MAGEKWWIADAALGLERKAAGERAARGVNPGDSFLIVTEGTVTEPEYFRLLRDDLKLSMVEIHVQPGDASHPLHVIATALRLVKERTAEMKKYREEQSFSKTPFDHVWAVIDTDVAVRDGIWNEVKQAAAAGNVSLAPSTPCIEYWLLLHLKYSTAGLTNGNAAKSALKAAGFDCSTTKAAEESVPRLISKWPQAVKQAERVRKYHFSGKTPEPANPSTDVDLLVQALDDSVPAHRRKL